MSSVDVLGDVQLNGKRAGRSHSAQGLSNVVSSPAMKIPLPPRLWITDIEDESSDGSDACDGITIERPRVRSRFRHHKQRANVTVPIGIFWDIENCQVPKGCSPIDVVAAIRAKFLQGRREADFVIVCDVRKEPLFILQELNDAQVNLIHVCGTQKNAADEKLRQCMRRFCDLHPAPSSLVLISGDINFAGDLSDFRHRKNMEVILVHKENTTSALIACASSHYCFYELLAHLPRNPRNVSPEEVPTCEVEVVNLPFYQPRERVAGRLRRLADNCGGKVVWINYRTATLRFPTPDHALRAIKRMEGEDVFGRKISTRFQRGAPPTYSSDEGYNTAPPAAPERPAYVDPSPPDHVDPSPLVRAQPTPIAKKAPQKQVSEDLSSVGSVGSTGTSGPSSVNDWTLALRRLPATTPPPGANTSGARPRQIRGTHGSANLDNSGGSSSNSSDERHDNSQSRAGSPWNLYGSFSDVEDQPTEMTVTNLPVMDHSRLQEMIGQLFSQFVTVLNVQVWMGNDGPMASVVVRSEWDARLAIARIHKRRLDHWSGRRLELSLGRPSPAPNLDVLRARLRAILLEQPDHSLPLMRLRDAYANRYCAPLTTSDMAKIKDTVVMLEELGRVVRLVDHRPVTYEELEEAPWKCPLHSTPSTSYEDVCRVLQPVYIQIATLARHVQLLLESHGGILPLLSFVECYESRFGPLVSDPYRGVALEVLLRAIPNISVRELPSRHIVWRVDYRAPSPPDHLSESSRSSLERERPRTAPALEPLLTLFERELTDLLRNAPRTTVPFSKLIPAFHHHFGRQCRVADYGFTKLPDLLAVLSNTIVVLGSGSGRVITLSAAAQGRRWTSDLVKLLRANPGRAVSLQDLPNLYRTFFDHPLQPADYGVCTLPELMERVTPNVLVFNPDGTMSLPRRPPTPVERGRTHQFAIEAVSLLCHTPNLRLEFSRFVPAYHAHFGRQLRVATYGCVKLAELFDLIPDAVTVGYDSNGERIVQLAERAANAIMAERVSALAPVPLANLSAAYAAAYGAPPMPSVVGATTLHQMVFAVGGCVEAGVVQGAGCAPHWVTAQLAAAAACVADRSVARGSTQEYFESAFRRLTGYEPQLDNLVASGVLEIVDRRICLTHTWRAIWRLACYLAEKSLATAEELLEECTRSHELRSCADMGFEGMADFLRSHRTVFKPAATEEAAAPAWTLATGVCVPRAELPLPTTHEYDYSLFDTPPGKKGSRVFESPKSRLWCSPPASALPPPTALLPQDKRRTRLAAAFDSA